MRQWIDIMEGMKLNPLHSTFWVNIKKNEIVDLASVVGFDEHSNHNNYVIDHPEVFGLENNELIKDAKNWTYSQQIGSEKIRVMAFERGWVRAHIRIDLGKVISVEALTTRDAVKAIFLIIHAYDELNPPESIYCDVHTPPRSAKLTGDQLKDFLASGKLRLR